MQNRKGTLGRKKKRPLHGQGIKKSLSVVSTAGWRESNFLEPTPVSRSDLRSPSTLGLPCYRGNLKREPISRTSLLPTSPHGRTRLLLGPRKNHPVRMTYFVRRQPGIGQSRVGRCFTSPSGWGGGSACFTAGLRPTTGRNERLNLHTNKARGAEFVKEKMTETCTESQF